MVIRVALGITELDPGGAERQLVMVARYLDPAVWEPRVYCLGPRGKMAGDLDEAGIPVTALDAHGAGDLWRVTRELSRLWKEEQIQLVQTFLFHANIVGRWAARNARIGAICSGLRVAERRNRWHGWVDRRTNSIVKRNICVSEGVRQWAEEVVGLPPAKSVVIPNAVDANRFAGAHPMDLSPWGLQAGQPVFACIGRLERQKGQRFLIDAWHDVLSTHPNAACLIVGEGPDRPALEKRIVELGLERSIRLTGRLENIPSLLAACRAVVLPSLWEGMPNVALEAMAAGKPVIATTVEGTAELVLEDQTGFRVPPADTGCLSVAVRRICADPALTSRLGTTAQALVAQQFTPETMARKYAQVWTEVLAEAG